MSGICASIVWAAPGPDAADGNAMAAAASFRGTTATEIWSSPEAVLVAQSANSAIRPQLSVDETTGAAVVADVRLDNRHDLLASLRRHLPPAAAAAAPSDAALVLAAWRKWGGDCPTHLLGDYAFVVWDPQSQQVFGARDPMAMRPLYYRFDGGRRLVAASEIAQILAAPDVVPAIDETTVAGYLLGTAPIEATAYRGIRQLAPGHAFLAEPGGMSTRRFWVLPPDRIRYRSERDYQEHFRALFQEAVACRIEKPGSVGILLSGGLDSGSIASMAGWLGKGTGERVRTYSWAFDELVECDERTVSRAITEHYGLPAEDVVVDDAWPLATYPDHGPHRDEPYVGAFQTGIERLLSAARDDGVTTVLSGDRGDLMVGDWVMDTPGLLAAGEWHLAWRDLRAARFSLPEAMLRDIVRPAFSSLWPPHRAPRLRRSLQRQTGRITPVPGWITPDAEKLAIGGPSGAHGVDSVTNAARRERYQLIFVREHQRGMIWSNRTYARYGQEFADPWSDVRIAEFILSIPQWVVQRREDPKYIAREAIRGVMPESALKASRKVSPEPLFDRGLRDRAGNTVTELLTDSRAAAAGFVDAGAAKDHYRNYRDGGDLHAEFWSLLCLEWWLRAYW
ncbi:MAG TPA: asparagine synthase-related protein [Acidimicrobiia bacterium]|nr:asparagine synthase-related protein [Acidimicrobiia bacterium]